MTNAKHTPGPWSVRKPGGTVVITLDARHGGYCEVARTVSGSLNSQREANARLIASAPDLLEALILALPYVEDASDSASPADQEIIRAAIAKATGEAA